MHRVSGWVCRVGKCNLLTSCCLSCVLPQPRSSRNAARPSSPVPAASTASSAASGVTGSRTVPTAATKRTAVSDPVFTPAAPLLRAGHSQRWLPLPQAPAFSAEPQTLFFTASGLCRCSAAIHQGSPECTGPWCTLFSVLTIAVQMHVCDPCEQVRHLRCREGNELIQGHAAHRWLSQFQAHSDSPLADSPTRHPSSVRLRSFLL